MKTTVQFEFLMLEIQHCNSVKSGDSCDTNISMVYFVFSILSELKEQKGDCMITD